MHFYYNFKYIVHYIHRYIMLLLKCSWIVNIYSLLFTLCIIHYEFCESTYLYYIIIYTYSTIQSLKWIVSEFTHAPSASQYNTKHKVLTLVASSMHKLYNNIYLLHYLYSLHAYWRLKNFREYGKYYTNVNYA